MKFGEEFVYALHKSSGCKIVDAFHENAGTAGDFCLPLGQGRFPLLVYLTGNGFGFFEHFRNELVLLTEGLTFLIAKAGSVAVL